MLHNKHTVERLWRMGATVTVPSEALYRGGPGELRRHVEGALFEQLSTLASWMAVTIHDDELNVESWLDPSYDAYRYTARWAPTNRTAQLVGGPAHGQLAQVHNPASDRVGGYERPYFESAFDAAYTPYRSIMAVYTLAGWDDVARHWLFAPEGTIWKPPEER